MKNVTRQRVLVGLVVIIIVAMLCAVSFVENTYKREAIVDRVEDGYYVLVDTTDNEWLYDSDELVIGQEVTMVMDTNGTDSNIYDDVIKKIIVRKE